MSVIPIDQRNDAHLFEATIELNRENIGYFRSSYDDYKKSNREYPYMSPLEEILMKASSVLMAGWVTEYMQESYQISLDNLEKLRYHRYFEISDSENRNSNQTNQEIYASFIEKVKLRNKDCEDICLMMITTFEIDELIENQVIRAKGVTERRLKRCLGSVPSPKKLPPLIIRTFCQALGANYEILNGINYNRRNNQGKSTSKKIDLYQVLLQFNYEQAVKQFTKEGQTKQRIRRIGAFLIRLNINDNLSHYWLYKRIKYKIEEISRFDTQKAYFDLQGNNIDVSCFNIMDKFHKQLHKTPIDILTNHNLIIIFNNIDSRSQEEIEIIIKEFWWPLVKQSRQAQKIGFLLMLGIYSPVDKRGKPTRFDPYFPDLEKEIIRKELEKIEKKKLKQEEEKLIKSLINFQQIIIPSKFHKSDFENIWHPLEDKFGQEAIIRNNLQEDVINLLWEGSGQGNPRETLEAFYRLFNLKIGSSSNLWEQWI